MLDLWSSSIHANPACESNDSCGYKELVADVTGAF